MAVLHGCFQQILYWHIIILLRILVQAQIIEFYDRCPYVKAKFLMAAILWSHSRVPSQTKTSSRVDFNYTICLLSNRHHFRAVKGTVSLRHCFLESPPLVNPPKESIATGLYSNFQTRDPAWYLWLGIGYPTVSVINW